MKSFSLQTTRKRILFANFPADGHFNPLTGLAVYLQQQGYDVRWYTSGNYAQKLKRLHIPHYPFKKAVDVSNGDFDKVFPGRDKQRSQIAKLKFDMEHAFIRRAPEYYADILDIRREFAFDIMIADCMFTGIPFIKEALHIPVIAIGVMPLVASSKDLPPAGLGMQPSYSVAGKWKQAILRFITDQLIFKQPSRLMHQLMDEAGIPHQRQSIFDMLVDKADTLLQSGAPGFEYPRRDMPANVHFVGALLPYENNTPETQWFDERLNRYKRVVLVTQGTVEKDINKLLVPTLEAFKDTATLVVCTTGGAQTALLQQRYPQANIIIEDFIPFRDIMPYADAYITNGGYGGVMLGIENNLPLVAAGVHEGKNEICARIGYFNIGINLKTENPVPTQIRRAVDEVIDNPLYKKNIVALSKSLATYNPGALCAAHVKKLLQRPANSKARTRLLAVKA
jgi:UDP:flavonoid glycosyltransferase YjiC (YdhE family)